MPQGKGTYGSKVGRPKKNLHTDPPRGGRSIPKVTPKIKKPDQRVKPAPKPKGPNHPTKQKLGSLLSQQSKKAGGKVVSPVKRATGGGQPVRKAKAPVRVKRTTAKRTSRK